MKQHNDPVFTNLKVTKHRTLSHQFTKVDFNLIASHEIKVELIGGLFKTTFIVWVDDKEVFRKVFYTLFLQFVHYSCRLDEQDCTITYWWFSGIWQGHIIVGGRAVV